MFTPRASNFAFYSSQGDFYRNVSGPVVRTQLSFSVRSTSADSPRVSVLSVSLYLNRISSLEVLFLMQRLYKHGDNNDTLISQKYALLLFIFRLNRRRKRTCHMKCHMTEDKLERLTLQRQLEKIKQERSRTATTELFALCIVHCFSL